MRPDLSNLLYFSITTYRQEHKLWTNPVWNGKRDGCPLTQKAWYKLTTDQDVKTQTILPATSSSQIWNSHPSRQDVIKPICFCLFSFPKKSFKNPGRYVSFFILKTFWKQPTEYVLCHFEADLLILLGKKAEAKVTGVWNTKVKPTVNEERRLLGTYI